MAEFEQNVEEYNVGEVEQTLDENNGALDEHDNAAEPQEHDGEEHDGEELPEEAQHQEEEQLQEEEEEPEGDSAPQEKVDEELSGAEVVEKKWPGWPGESVFRMLVPVPKVGGIIGRKGEFIKKIVEETRARIKILDGPHGTAERAVMVSAKEEPDSSLPPAMDGLLRIHKRLIDGSEGDSANPHPGSGGKISTRLLVAASQAGSLIGKQGGTVKTIQEESNCIVRVLGKEDLPVFALHDDRVVEVVGDASGVHKGIELIASHLRKFLVDRSIIPLFEMQMQMAKAPPVDHHMPPHQPWGPPQGPPMNAPPGPYGHNPQYMPPPRHDSYYPPPELPPPVDHQAHQGISTYGREAPMGGHAPSSGQSAPSMIKQITQQMQIPLSFADAVIGAAGSSISYIRRTSGATVTIQETRGVPNEMTVEISGNASQVHSAQQLIHNFMAEAGATVAQPQAGATMDQGYNAQAYNSYQAHGSVYASPPSNQGHAGAYGNVYGSNYGY